ncbi:QWRF motif-containing protein 7-like isoform X1 [Phragmites australis]|uniref:QWRF motif-containing protein 7-like isoform X1 n=1 Tax=Phragmites australis TaxID=29695 RepID=UPI002D795EBE|nr:QWRF motif-containing protein 7-like isoform X1 [Phragmites australis]
MESGGAPRPRTSASSRRPCAAEASRAGSGAFVYDGMRATPLSTSTANFTRSLRKGASFAQKKPLPSADVPPLRSSKENNSAGEDALLAPPRRSMPEPGVDARGLWEPSPRRRRSTGSEDAAGRGSSGALREMMARRKEEPEKEEAAHRARVLTARLLQWRFANARMEKAMARATSAAENRLFYTWLRVAELRNIQAAKRIVAQRRRQKLKLARLLRPQLPLLASWEPLAKPHTDATADLGRVLSAACTNLPLAAGAQADLQSLHDTMFSCLGTVNEIEAITDMFHAPVRTHSRHCESAQLRSITLLPRAGRRDEQRARRARADDPAGVGVPGGSHAAVQHRHRLADAGSEPPGKFDPGKAEA